MKSINYQGAIISTSKKSLRNSAFNLLLLLLIASVIFHYLTRYTDCAFDQENLRVNIKPVYLDPVLNKSLSTPQITHMYEKHGINHHRLPYNQKAPAITVANILTELSYDFDSFTLGLTGKSCYFVKNTNLVLTLAQTVYINRESYKDDCEFNASFDHEMKHLHVNKNVLERNLPVFEEHLLNGMKYFSSKYGQGPFKLKELPKIKYNFYQYMQASLDTAANLATEDIKAAQKRVDTKEEYQRVSSLCRWGIPSTNNPTSNLPYTGIPPNNSNNPSGSFNSGR